MKTSTHLGRWLSGCFTAVTSLCLLGTACAAQEPEPAAAQLATSLAAVTSPSPCSADLARGRPVTSSGWWATGTPELAVDGSSSTQWLTNMSTGAWLRVDLGQTYDIDRAVVTWGWDFNFGTSADSVLEASVDGTTWTLLATSTRYTATCNGSGGMLCYTPETLTFQRTAARYVRFRGTRWNYGWGHLNDLELYAATDFARGRSVTSSGWWSTSTPELAVDGNTSSQWLSNTSTGAWLQVDLQQQRVLDRSLVTWGWDSTNGASADSVVEASADGSTWTQLYTSTRYTSTCGSGGMLCYTPEYRTFPPTTARYVRFRGTRWNSGWGHLNDFEFYGSCGAPTSCKDLHTRAPTAPSGLYTLDPDGSGPGQPFDAWCDMTSDGGGWTLAMKLDGTLGTFAYDSALWTNAQTYQPAAAAMDHTEAKLESFSTIPVTELRLGMDTDGTARWIRASLGTPAASLLSALQSGANVPLVTSTDAATRRALWKSLIPNSSLQLHCSQEAINTIGHPNYVIARIGIIANQEDNCDSTDSAIGFGLRSFWSVPTPSTGNAAGFDSDNGDRYTQAFGYIFVR